MGKLPHTGAAGMHSSRLALPTFEALIVLIFQHWTTLPLKLPAVFACPRLNLIKLRAICRCTGDTALVKAVGCFNWVGTALLVLLAAVGAVQGVHCHRAHLVHVPGDL
eukprot:scaffold273926_cov28-Prasinocladus_malaysianus.AAC.1